MEKYLEELSNKFNETNFSNLQFTKQFRFLYDEILDDNLFSKYEGVIWGNDVNVSVEDAFIFQGCLEHSYHILIEIYLVILIRSCKDERLSIDSLSYYKKSIDWYFENNKDHDNIPTASLDFIIKKMIHLEKSFKNEILEYFFNACKTSDYKICVFYVVSILMRNHDICIKMKEYDYTFFIDLIDVEVIDIYNIFNFYVNLISIYTDNITNKAIKRKLCEFVYAHLYDFEDRFAHSKLPLILEFMADVRFDQQSIIDIQVYLKKLNTNALSQLQQHSIKIPDEMIIQFNKHIKEIKDKYISFSNNKKIIEMLIGISPVTKKDINAGLKVEDESLFGMIRRNVLDSTGKLINYKELNEIEEYSLRSSPHILDKVNILLDLYYRTFLDVYDNSNVEEELKDIFGENTLIGSNINYFIKFVKDFLSGEYLYTFSQLIIFFESSLRNYFETKGLNIMKGSKPSDVIGLSGFFNYRDNNQFRDILLETIDEDYYFILTWLLTDEYGMNFRGKIFHGINNLTMPSSTIAVYTSILIIRFFIAF